MAQDIVPIRLELTAGTVVSLWAPRWREGGEEWEAFLGHGEHIYAFDDTAELAAFVRTAAEHDLTDHPAWHLVPQLDVDELSPHETQHYDLVGVPELVAEDPDNWTIGELYDVVTMIRSLASVCDLEPVHDVLDSAEGFGILNEGLLPFTGREGQRLWTDVATTIAERWDEVLDAIDALITKPELDADAVDAARAELAAMPDADEELADTDSEEGEDGESDERGEGADADEDVDDEAGDEQDDDEEDDEDEPLSFWEQVGIDPILIITPDGESYTLRCYLDDEPMFLGSDGTIEVFRSPKALAKYLAGAGASGHDLAGVSTWSEITTTATSGELGIEVDPDNTYVLTGLADDLAGGPETVDPNQLDLAVELITDAADWAGDESVGDALAPSETLGWLVSFVLQPDPTRLAPSAPFDADVAAWKQLVNGLVDRLHLH